MADTPCAFTLNGTLVTPLAPPADRFTPFQPPQMAVRDGTARRLTTARMVGRSPGGAVDDTPANSARNEAEPLDAASGARLSVSRSPELRAGGLVERRQAETVGMRVAEPDHV